MDIKHLLARPTVGVPLTMVGVVGLGLADIALMMDHVLSQVHSHTHLPIFTVIITAASLFVVGASISAQLRDQERVGAWMQREYPQRMDRLTARLEMSMDLAPNRAARWWVGSKYIPYPLVYMVCTTALTIIVLYFLFHQLGVL